MSCVVVTIGALAAGGLHLALRDDPPTDDDPATTVPPTFAVDLSTGEDDVVQPGLTVPAPTIPLPSIALPSPGQTVPPPTAVAISVP
jgi:hypothetical protein